MDMAYKYQAIDNAENRSKVADVIVEKIFKEKNISPSKSIREWLHNEITSCSLEDIIECEQKVYVVRLANKVAADIMSLNNFKPVFIDVTASDEALNLIESYGWLGEFVINTWKENGCDIAEKIENAIHRAAKYEVFGENVIVDKDNTIYVFKTENNSDKKRIYELKLEISYHRDYTLGNLTRRINGRMRYKWDDVEIDYIETTYENGKYYSEVVFFTKQDKDDVLAKISHRFGSTSGKPWHRSHIVSVEQI